MSGGAVVARIRSLHPTLFTDEAYASLPMSARVLLTGIWTEADDHGVFEWKPLGLKMKVFPADAFALADMNTMMQALSDNDCIKEFEIGGKRYGAVRNFCRWQKPKKPTYWHPKKDATFDMLPNWCRSYVAFGHTSEGEQLPTNTEKTPLVEGGGGRGKGKGEHKTSIESLERVAPATSEAPSAAPPGSLSEATAKVLKEVAAKPSALSSAIGTELPATWTPDEELCQDVKREFGMYDHDISTELVAFHAHHAAAGSFSANWRASFLTWCKRWREHRDKQVKPRVEVSKTTEPKRQMSLDDAVAMFARLGFWSKYSPVNDVSKVPA